MRRIGNFSRDGISLPESLAITNVKLPEEYVGFLLMMSLQLTGDQIKLLLNYTQGSMKPRSIKEWLRVHETEFDWKTNSRAAPKGLVVNYVDEQPYDQIGEDDLEVLMGALDELSEDGNPDEDPDEVFDEEDAKEILSAMARDQSKSGYNFKDKFKRTFKAVNAAKKSRSLARGYGVNRDAGSERRASGPAVREGGSYKLSIKALKKKTRCASCGQVGHWHKECPKKAGSSSGARPSTSSTTTKELNYLNETTDEAYFIDYMEYLNYKEQNVSRRGNGGARPSSAAYTERVRELLWSECYTNHEINEDHCATVDTGCQRTAVGSDTLARLLARQPEGLSVCYLRPTASSLSME